MSDTPKPPDGNTWLDMGCEAVGCIYCKNARDIPLVAKAARDELAVLRKFREFVEEVAADSHDDICPLRHPAYRHKWCAACEASKLTGRTPKLLPGEWSA